jgi:hypothetical protein
MGYTELMARNPTDVIPASMLKLIDEDSELPSPDWYVASAESGRDTDVLAALEQPVEDEAAKPEAAEAAPELADIPG